MKLNLYKNQSIENAQIINIVNLRCYDNYRKLTQEGTA